MNNILIYNKKWTTSKTADDVSQKLFTARMTAYQQFIERHNGKVLEVQNVKWYASKIYRLFRPYTLLSELKSLNPNIIYLQYPTYPFFWSLDRTTDLRRSIMFAKMLTKYCKKEDIKIILDYRDMLLWEQTTYSKDLFYQFEQLVFNSPDEIWTSSPGYGIDAITRYGIDKNKLRTVLNGSFPSNVSHKKIKDKSKISFVYTGDLSDGPRNIRKVINILCDVDNPKVSFTLVGPNSEWLKKINLPKHIEVRPEMPRSEIMNILSQSDIGMLPLPRNPYFDINFPTKLGEYVQCGLSILATDCPVIKDFILEREIGFAVTIDKWVEQINYIANNPDIIENMKNNSIKHSESMLWDNIYDNAYFEMLKKLNLKID
ncbi:MAG: glycosyltransferase [Armatimonadota bacterium]